MYRGRTKPEEKPRNKFREMREDATRRILDASIELFSEYGYAGTTMQMIAERAGVVPSGIYHYYENKDILFGAVVDELSRYLTDWVIDNSYGIDISPEYLDKFYSYCVRTAKDSRTNIRLLLRLLLQQEEVPECHVKKMTDVIQLVKYKLPQYTHNTESAIALEEIVEDLFAVITMYMVAGSEAVFERQTNDIKKRFLTLAEEARKEQNII